MRGNRRFKAVGVDEVVRHSGSRCIENAQCILVAQTLPGAFATGCDRLHAGSLDALVIQIVKEPDSDKCLADTCIRTRDEPALHATPLRADTLR